jgi:hypothetical protein
VDVVPRLDHAQIGADAQTDAALLALVRLLARQAARDVFERTATDDHGNHSLLEGRE